MGTFHHPLTLVSSDGSRTATLNALVDTGSTYSVVPSSMLQELDVQPQWSSAFELADGRRELFQMAEARLRINEQERTTICVFGKPGMEPILGAYALEGFGLAADPVNRRLIPAQLYLL